MPIIGIIAEFDPFHNGHRMLMDLAAQKTGADRFVCVMSGDFVQRGCPAVCDKTLRTRLALAAGIDAVFELPVSFACSSAESFAYGGVSLLSSLKAIDYIAFGSECGDISVLKSIAAVLDEEPEEYKLSLRALLKDGLTFPAARQAALEHAALSGKAGALSQAAISDILSGPNNILAIEYCKAALRLKRAGINVPGLLTFKRTSSYLEDTPHNAHDTSASALRRMLCDAGCGITAIAPYVPDAVLSELSPCYMKRFPITLDDFSSVLYSALLSSKDNGFDSNTVGETGQDLLNSIFKCISAPISFSSLIASVKTRNITYSAVSRALISIMLGLCVPACGVSSGASGAAGPAIPYARLLGFKKASSDIIRLINGSCSVEVINKLADAKTASPLLKNDIRAARLYNQIVFDKFGTRLPDEYETGVVIV